MKKINILFPLIFCIVSQILTFTVQAALIHASASKNPYRERYLSYNPITIPCGPGYRDTMTFVCSTPNSSSMDQAENKKRISSSNSNSRAKSPTGSKELLVREVLVLPLKVERFLVEKVRMNKVLTVPEPLMLSCSYAWKFLPKKTKKVIIIKNESPQAIQEDLSWSPKKISRNHTNQRTSVDSPTFFLKTLRRSHEEKIQETLHKSNENLNDLYKFVTNSKANRKQVSIQALSPSQKRKRTQSNNDLNDPFYLY